MPTATSHFSIVKWDEKPYHEYEGGRKLTRASVVYAYTGDIVGQSTLDYVMAYFSPDEAQFVGLEHIVGSLAGREGSFVLRHSGIAKDNVVTAHYEVLAETAAGELVGLTGKGTYTFGHLDRYPMTLDYELPNKQTR